MFASVRFVSGTALVVAFVLTLSGAASAQVIPPPSFGWWGSAYPFDTYMSQADSDYLTNREMAAEGAQQAQANWSGVNQSMLANANAQDQALLNQRQTAKNWWFNYQAQQLPQERAELEAASRRREADARFGAPGATSAPASREIMQWPILLRQPEFTSQRDAIEAPFLRAASGGKPVSIDDYRMIVQIAQNMKTQVPTVGADWPYAEITQVNDYLDLITKQAETRIRGVSASGSPSSEKPAASGGK